MVISGQYWYTAVATGIHLAWSLPMPLRATAVSLSSWPLRILTSTMGFSPSSVGPMAFR